MYAYFYTISTSNINYKMSIIVSYQSYLVVCNFNNTSTVISIKIFLLLPDCIQITFLIGFDPPVPIRSNSPFTIQFDSHLTIWFATWTFKSHNVIIFLIFVTTFESQLNNYSKVKKNGIMEYFKVLKNWIYFCKKNIFFGGREEI